MGHQAMILAVVIGQIVEIIGIGVPGAEILKIDRQAGVDGVALGVEKAGVRENGVDDTDPVEITRHLVADTLSDGIDGGQFAPIIGGDRLDEGRRPSSAEQGFAVPLQGLVPERQFARTGHGRMRGQNLLGQGGSRAR